jgi:hypothetical protein
LLTARPHHLVELDSTVRNADLVRARGPGLQLSTVTAGEGHMIEAGAMLIEPATCAIEVGVQAEQLPSIEREHRVVKTAVCSSSSSTGPAPTNDMGATVCPFPRVSG